MSCTIHWLGVGLSSTSGIRYLARHGHKMTIWNRSLEKAKDTIRALGIKADVRALTDPALSDTLEAGDILVSMLPAPLHPHYAGLCLDKGAHFVSSSYIAPEMRALDGAAREQGLSFVNEVGLDPGLDHLLAHLLVEEAKADIEDHADNRFSFRSYCGGFPKVANDFRYKFSWSPLGVLKALTSPAQWIEGGNACQSRGPWEALKQVPIGAGGETFEAYPNRDSLPFLGQYLFPKSWQIEEFVRGTLRLDGWAKAWQPLFDEVGQLKGDEGLTRMEAIAIELQKKYSYDEGEPDRVVLSVTLEVTREGKTIWHREYALDAAGNDKGQAMARLVSLPVALAVEGVKAGDLPTGVSAAPHDRHTIEGWLSALESMGERFEKTDHLA
ncbi:MAG: saccharopine dehydrogenase NADP-binding domain-containing protein [Alphaproteobacteria bacterium]|nr:saccharopine dehydrogenase NADP-binding domain-containing protein [Alphaproteobacteria bacterium]